MFGLNSVKIISAVLSILFIGSMVFGFWKFVAGLQETNYILTEKVGKFEAAIETQTATIEVQANALKEFQEAQERLETEIEELLYVTQEAGKERQRLLEIFADSDFTAIVNDRPGLSENLINRGTDRAFRLLECVSDSRDNNCSDRDPQTRTDYSPKAKKN